jgi:hypothetical protein
MLPKHHALRFNIEFFGAISRASQQPADSLYLSATSRAIPLLEKRSAFHVLSLCLANLLFNSFLILFGSSSKCSRTIKATLLSL